MNRHLCVCYSSTALVIAFASLLPVPLFSRVLLVSLGRLPRALIRHSGRRINTRRRRGSERIKRSERRNKLKKEEHQETGGEENKRTISFVRYDESLDW